VGQNIGFAKAHNLVLEKIAKCSTYHLILNPDVVFEPSVLSNLIAQLAERNEVAMVSPKVIYPNGKLQYTCRKYPSFSQMLFRRIGIFKNQNQKNEYQDFDLTQPFFPDFIHGCFLLFKTADFLRIKGFDERYFLYMEDVDICKKIDVINKKKMYVPCVEIKHIHRKGSAKKIKLLYYHIISSIKYFIKWL
jgi:GT2 family glycosyltransferase